MTGPNRLAGGAPASRPIVLTSHPGAGGAALPVRWGAADPASRGPIVATLNNPGTLNLTTDQIINGASNGTINNSGTLEKTAGTGTSTISTIVNNTGTVNAASGTLTLNGGLVRSSNVSMSQFGAMIDPQTRLDYLKKFGVGQGTALNWSAEPKGSYHEVADWDNQTYYTTTFGQAFTVTVPPALKRAKLSLALIVFVGIDESVSMAMLS